LYPLLTNAPIAAKPALPSLKTSIMADQNPAGEDIAMRRRRMRYRAWHRGTQEMDMVLGPYADAHLDALDTQALDRLEKLMDEEDTDLLKWVMGQEPVRAGVDAELLGVLVAYLAERVRPK
jgi:antitoxin CptB